MMQKTRKTSQLNYFITSSFGIVAILMAVAIITYPDTAFNASLRGLRIWWEIVFPALLPFFIAAEVLLAFGVVHFMGVLLEPLMRPLFNVPGVGAFVMAMGFASGYPMGAKLTTRLREQNLITRSEGERLVSFTSTSDPLFLFGAVAVGFFHNVELGAFLATVHYVSSIIVGMVMRFHEKKHTNLERKPRHESENMLIRAFKSMNTARLSDDRKLGKILGDAVMSSMYTLSMIGGFMMFFSVVLSLLTEVEINLILSNFLSLLLGLFGISKQLGESMVYGLFEVTLGAKSVSEVISSVPMVHKLAVVSAISAWGGISVQAQIAALLQKTDIRYTPFLFARIVHSVLAFFIALLLWEPFLNSKTANSIPTFMMKVPANTPYISYSSTFIYLGQHFVWLTAILFTISVILYILKKRYKNTYN